MLKKKTNKYKIFISKNFLLKLKLKYKFKLFFLIKNYNFKNILIKKKIKKIFFNLKNKNSFNFFYFFIYNFKSFKYNSFKNIKSIYLEIYFLFKKLNNYLKT